jgi:hypothetical protein
MARPPVGTAPQEQTETALFAFLAARLIGIGFDDYDRFFEQDLRTKVRHSGARRAAQHARQLAEAAGRPAPFEERLLVDEHALGLEKVVIRVPGVRESQGERRARLRALPQLRQLIETEVSGDLYAVAVVRNSDERRALRDQLDELGDPLPEMEPVRFETQAPARRMWCWLAERAAREEQLTVDVSS